MTGRVMALDVGERTVGVAISDPAGCIAQPYLTLRRGPGASELQELARLVCALEVREVVVGLPVRTDGRQGPEASRVAAFARLLAEHLAGVPVHLYDERFSTQEAERTLVALDLSRRRRRQATHAVAAALVLDGFLKRWQGQMNRQATGDESRARCRAPGPGGEDSMTVPPRAPAQDAGDLEG